LGPMEMAIKRFLLTFSIVFLFASFARSQDEQTVKKLFQDAIEAMGGEAFLNAKDMYSEGQFFAFNNEGESSNLIKFVDYTKIPDKSRHESGNRKSELEISVFNLEKNEGWIYEPGKGGREAKPDEMRGFRSVVKHSLDIIFRYRYKYPQEKLFYLGPGEGQDVTMELVKIVDPENDETTIYFNRITKLPAKIEYHEVNKRGIRVRIVDEFSQWHVFQGVNTPLRIDGSINGRRASQTFVIKISFNNNLADSLFSKPIPPK
jgi:hypothetical protein